MVSRNQLQLESGPRQKSHLEWIRHLRSVPTKARPSAASSYCFTAFLAASKTLIRSAFDSFPTVSRSSAMVLSVS